MRNILPIFVSLAIFSSVGCIALAQSPTPQATTRRDAAKERIETRRVLVQEKKEDIKARIASRAAELKLKLQTFRDQRKARLIERINEVLNQINQKRTEQMNKHLDNMSRILGRVEERISSSTESADIAEAQTALNNSKAAIQKAKDAVASQSAKDYSITISSESAAKAEIKTMRDKLHTDLRAVRELVIAAKQSVALAIQITARTLGGIR